MELTHHLTPCTSVSYSKLQSLFCFPGVWQWGCGHCWALPSSCGSGSEEEGKCAKMHWQVSTQLHLLFTRGTQGRKSLAPSVQPSYGVLEPSLVPAWHNVLAVPVATSRYALNRFSSTDKASEREERETNVSSQVSVEEILHPHHRPHKQVTHLEADCRHNEQGQMLLEAKNRQPVPTRVHPPIQSL